MLPTWAEIFLQNTWMEERVALTKMGWYINPFVGAVADTVTFPLRQEHIPV